jgi:hypothetical protein
MSNTQIIFSNPEKDKDIILFSLKTISDDLPVYLYYLTWTSNQTDPGNTLTLEESIERNGFYIFSQLADLKETVDITTLWTKLGSLNTGITIAWVRDTSLALGTYTYFQALDKQSTGEGIVIGRIYNFKIELYGMMLRASDIFQLRIDVNKLTAEIYTIKEENKIRLLRNRVASVDIQNEQTIAITISLDVFSPQQDKNSYPDITKKSPGALSFQTTTWNLYDFYNIINGVDEKVYGGGFRYYYQEQNVDKAITYPFYGEVLEGNTASANFAAQLDLLHIDVPYRSYFIVTDGSKAEPIFQPPNMGCFSRFGNRIRLSPVSDYGFYIAKTAAADGLYLTPIGIFEFELDESPTKSDVLLGLSTLEYANIEAGSLLKLIPNSAAYTTSFEKKNTNDYATQVTYTLSEKTLAIQNAEDIEELLIDTYSTSYAQIIPPISKEWDYFSQPVSSSYYSQTANDCDFPYANSLQIKIGSLSNDPTNILASFPMAFYWNIIKGNNASAAVISAFEKQILTVARYNQFLPLATKGYGPQYKLQDQNLQRVFSTRGFLCDLNENAALDKIENTIPNGTIHKIIFAKSNTEYLSINAQESGVVDATLSTALMNSEGFIVMNDWGDKFPMDHKLTVEGFTFNIAKISYQSEDIVPIMIFKYGQTSSLLELIDDPSSWSNPAYFLADGNVNAVTAQLQKAILQAESTIGAENDPFAYFRKEILSNKRWTGQIIFNSPLDGNNMPSDLQMLMAGLDGPLIAHHFGVELNQLAKIAPPFSVDIEKSSLFGVIYYENENKPQTAKAVPSIVENRAAISSNSYPLALNETPTEDYKFLVNNLIVLFQNSTIENFDCEVGLMINKLFSRPVFLQGEKQEVPMFNDEPIAGEINTFTIKGNYQKIAEVGTISFNSNERHTYDFNPNGYYVRALDSFIITSAALDPVKEDAIGTDTTNVASKFSVNGELTFSNPIIPGKQEVPDIFSYGVLENDVVQGLKTTGLEFNIEVTLDTNGQPIQASRKVTLVTSSLSVQETRIAERDNSLLKAFPFKLSGFLQGTTTEENDTPFIDIKTLGKEVNIVQLVGNTVTKPMYGLRYELPLGSLGALAEAHVSIDAHMIMTWGPSDATPDNDGVSLYIQLPEASAGISGFDLEGIVKTVFGDANLMKVSLDNDKYVYVLLFNNVGISILGIKFPPKVISDFVVFGDPSEGTNGNVGWSVAATQASE